MAGVEPQLEACRGRKILILLCLLLVLGFSNIVHLCGSSWSRSWQHLVGQGRTIAMAVAPSYKHRSVSKFVAKSPGLQMPCAIHGIMQEKLRPGFLQPSPRGLEALSRSVTAGFELHIPRMIHRTACDKMRPRFVPSLPQLSLRTATRATAESPEGQCLLDAGSCGEAILLNEGGLKKRRVLMLHTGGTIGMMEQSDGSLGVTPGALFKRLQLLEELNSPKMPQVFFLEFNPILDSSDMTPTDWNIIASTIEDNYYDFDGFVIIHGTDTMAYTASALSFMLEQLSKPVIVTGSQIPIFAPVSDARQNLLASIAFAGLADICEVGIVFHDRLLRGNRATKMKANALDAFVSPKFPNLGQLGVEISLFRDRLCRAPSGRFRKQAIEVTEIIVVWVIPGFSDLVLEPLLRSDTLRGMVIMLYGCGNAPKKHNTFLTYVKALVSKGIVVVACSQCMEAQVDFDKYSVGKALEDCGVVSAGDMTTEATVTKLSYLLSKGLPVEDIRHAMRKDLRGEVSGDREERTFSIRVPT